MEYNWEGPYRIIEYTSRGTYKLENKFGKVLAREVSSINFEIIVTGKCMLIITAVVLVSYLV